MEQHPFKISNVLFPLVFSADCAQSISSFLIAEQTTYTITSYTQVNIQNKVQVCWVVMGNNYICEEWNSTCPSQSANYVKRAPLFLHVEILSSPQKGAQHCHPLSPQQWELDSSCILLSPLAGAWVQEADSGFLGWFQNKS